MIFGNSKWNILLFRSQLGSFKPGKLACGFSKARRVNLQEHTSSVVSFGSTKGATFFLRLFRYKTPFTSSIWTIEHRISALKSLLPCFFLLKNELHWEYSSMHIHEHFEAFFWQLSFKSYLYKLDVSFKFVSLVVNLIAKSFKGFAF